MSAHILIADDDEVSCQLFAETLEAEGFQVEQTTSGEAALSRLAEETLDLLIIDVRMPGTSGLEVTRIVHEKYPSLPIIVMTAFGSIETAVEAIHEGAFDFISKPMNLAELKDCVPGVSAAGIAAPRGNPATAGPMITRSLVRSLAKVRPCWKFIKSWHGLLRRKAPRSSSAKAAPVRN
jgi:DNA-binding NtrC family response regulator